MNNNLIEISAVRSLIKRSFPNDAKTIVGELLQNSQRSGASYIDFFTKENGIVIFDDGSGIKDFQDLIVLGKSKYTEPVMQHQHPMGIGFQSLLAHDRIIQVEVLSASQSITIDTQRWWQDDDYAENWQSLVRESDINRGVAILIKADAEFVTEFEECFAQKQRVHRAVSSCQGYRLCNLSIRLNGQDIDTGYPDWVKRGEVLFLDRYEGNLLIVYSSPFGTSAGFSLVNWYGQLIKAKTNLPFGFLYEVTKGRPLEPQAPIREGIIQDAKWQNFIGSIVDRIVEHFRSLVESPRHFDVEGYYNMRNNYPEIPHCPFFSARQALGYREEHDESIERQGKTEVFRYSDYKLVNALHPELIENRLYLHNIDEELVENYLYDGYESFVRLLDRPLYLPEKYHSELLNDRIKAFHWRVGKPIEAEHGYDHAISFYQAGEFTLTKNVEQADWQPITKDVFAIAERSPCCLSDCEAWLFGVTTTPVDAVDEYTLAGYRHADSNCSDYFIEEIQSVVIDLSGKALGSDISRECLKSFVAKEQNVEIAQIKDVGIVFNKKDTATVTAKVDGKLIEIKEVRIIES